MIEKCNQLNKELNTAIDVVKIEKMDQSSFYDLRDQVLQQSIQATVKITDVNNKLEATDNYIARYLPLNNFCAIIEACKVVQIKLNKDAELRERIDNYEKYKMRELYQNILFDDGRAPKNFNKEHLVLDRKTIDETLNKEVRLLSRNLRFMQIGPFSHCKKGGVDPAHIDCNHSGCPQC